MKTFKGNLDGKHCSIGIVASEYNKEIVDNLIAGAVEVLKKHDVPTIDIYRVPGAFEIPLTLQKLAETKKYDGLIALGCVIKGRTGHYELINKHLQEGITWININYSIPIAFEVITAHSIKLAQQRSDMNKINIGREAAEAIIKTVNLLKKID